jgi:hypothetical protein
MVVLEKLALSLKRITNGGYNKITIIEEILNISTTLGNSDTSQTYL